MCLYSIVKTQTLKCKFLRLLSTFSNCIADDYNIGIAAGASIAILFVVVLVVILVYVRRRLNLREKKQNQNAELKASPVSNDSKEKQLAYQRNSSADEETYASIPDVSDIDPRYDNGRGNRRKDGIQDPASSRVEEYDTISFTSIPPDYDELRETCDRYTPLQTIPKCYTDYQSPNTEAPRTSNQEETNCIKQVHKEQNLNEAGRNTMFHTDASYIPPSNIRLGYESDRSMKIMPSPEPSYKVKENTLRGHSISTTPSQDGYLSLSNKGTINREDKHQYSAIHHSAKELRRNVRYSSNNAGHFQTSGHYYNTNRGFSLNGTR